MTPFVQEFFDVFRTIAYYLIVVGALLAVYVVIRVLYAFLYAFLPSPILIKKHSKKAKCLKCATMTAKAFGKLIYQVLKPWVHVPLIIGILMIIVSLMYVTPSINKVDQQIRLPLNKTDQAIMNVIYKMNDFTRQAPLEVKEFMDGWMDVVFISAFNAIQSLLNDFNGVLKDINDFVQDDVEPLVNNLMDAIGAPHVAIPTWDQNTLRIGVPSEFVPSIPAINVDSLLVREDLISVQRAIVPWVDDRIAEARKVSSDIFWIGFGIAILPAISLILAFASGFLPKKFKKWMRDPGFHGSLKKKKKKGKNADIEMTSKE